MASRIPENRNNSKAYGNASRTCARKRNTVIEEQKLVDRNLTSKPQEIVEQFVTYFTDIGENLAANIRKPTLPVSVPRRTVNLIELIETTTQEVKSVVRNSAGVDGLWTSYWSR
ncbi:hypothetical protein HHI36_023909 [Cryptolaemus montrouzieri]|uniref:Uncharacterized protein n=1 Tax=Cryptolaemus montrouzieri TaxID=559131 RepID=A0ABD2N1T2_9CUCU